MWDPNDMLTSWARDEDVLSWRSLDTLRGMDIDLIDDDPMHRDPETDVSDAEDELVELMEKQNSRTAAIQPLSGPTDKGGLQSMRSLPTADGFSQNQWAQPAHADQRRPQYVQDDPVVCELPSTSEMVSFRESVQGQDSVCGHHNNRPSFSPSKHGTSDVDSEWTTKTEMPAMMNDYVQRSPNRGEPRRVSMTLADLVAKKNDSANSNLLLPPPSVPIATYQPPPPIPIILPPVNSGTEGLEKRYEDLLTRERHLQAVLTKQLQQIDSLSDQLLQQDLRFQNQQLEISGFKEQIARLERQNAMLQTSLQQKEQAQEQHTQLFLQRANELTTLEAKVRSLQSSNEAFQEQARKATEDKDKVHKDYLQVVYDLGKLQKQMNAAAKETVSIADKDLLLREIDHLRHEKDQLGAKLKDVEVRKSSLLQNNAVVEVQKVRELQNRVRELEEDLNRARNARPVPSSSQSAGSQSSLSSLIAPTSQTVQSATFDGYASVPHRDQLRSSVVPPVSSWQAPIGIPSLIHGVPSTPPLTKPMTLKDMMGDRRPQPLTASTSMSLASLGYSAADRRTTGASTAFDYEQSKANALARHGSSIGDGRRSQDYAFPTAPDPTISAPFATEKQSFLHDSVHKRELEQQLLKLHVDKEQADAKLLKLDQTGLKTMSTRTEKASLERRVQDLTHEISKLKLALR